MLDTYILLNERKEGRKKEASKVKQTNTHTQGTCTCRPPLVYTCIPEWELTVAMLHRIMEC